MEYVIWIAILFCLVVIAIILSKMSEKVSIIDDINRVKVDSNSVENAVKEADARTKAEVEILKKSI